MTGDDRLMRWPAKRRIALLLGLVVTGSLVYVFVIAQPSNDREWVNGFETPASITLTDTTLTIRHVRALPVGSSTDLAPPLLDRTIDLEHVERVWFVYEPFAAQPIPGFRGGAHTFFIFDIRGEPPIAVSVEARREQGETYNVWAGLANQYELMYVWATEEDQIVRRAVDLERHLYMFPLQITQPTAVHLLTQLAQTSAELEVHPRFYNTLTSNCTNELAKNANSLQPGAIPHRAAWWLPGYAIDVLYELGYIPNDRPLTDVLEQHDISEFVRETYRDPHFSELLRARLLQAPQ